MPKREYDSIMAAAAAAPAPVASLSAAAGAASGSSSLAAGAASASAAAASAVPKQAPRSQAVTALLQADTDTKVFIVALAILRSSLIELCAQDYSARYGSDVVPEDKVVQSAISLVQSLWHMLRQERSDEVGDMFLKQSSLTVCLPGRL